MKGLRINIDKTLDFITTNDIRSYEYEMSEHIRDLVEKTGKGSEFTGWLGLPSETERDLLKDIRETVKNCTGKSEIFVVVGIGGSYLGARAVIDALNHHFVSLTQKKSRKHPIVVYAGNNISEDYLSDLISVLDKKDYSMAVISKSGTTTEPAIAFRILKQHIEGKYGKEKAAKRILAITDKEKGALKKLADAEGYKTYVIPDDVGGRYSVFTPVGLVPIAAAGFSISRLIRGARKMQEFLLNEEHLRDNPACLYAATRNVLYRRGKTTEILVTYDPSLQYFAEWWKQLFGESEGKGNKGIFPASVGFTADLHSMGQYIQDGERNIFETVIRVAKPKAEIRVPEAENDLDGLNYMSGKRLSEINEMARIGTQIAHVDGRVPNITISIPAIDEESIGALLYFFEFSCAISGYALGVNPFDQPGVEDYKTNMFALLGKPGFEEKTEEIRKRI
ncbi:MAG: glucose-6-phosphate isomerase [Bacteroidetes bacterium]|nr:glucose-6-phosphate isomerase [Bacteroidota bacterium]